MRGPSRRRHRRRRGHGARGHRRHDGPHASEEAARSPRTATGCATCALATSRRFGSSPEAVSHTAQRRSRPSTRATSSRPSSAPKRRSGRSRAARQPGSPGARSTFAPRSCPCPRRDADQVLRPVGPARRGRAASDEVTRLLRHEPGTTAHMRLSSNGLAGRYGEFDPWAHFFGPRRRVRLLQGLRVADLLVGRGRI